MKKLMGLNYDFYVNIFLFYGEYQLKNVRPSNEKNLLIVA